MFQYDRQKPLVHSLSSQARLTSAMYKLRDKWAVRRERKKRLNAARYGRPDSRSDSRIDPGGGGGG